jgi:hypothetical protein
MPLNKVNADSIADGTVIASDIADGAITLAKLQSGLLPSAAANSGSTYANSGFAVANSGSSYANSAFLSANNGVGVDLTQNTNITSAASYANSAFLKANTPGISNGQLSVVSSAVGVIADSAAGRLPYKILGQIQTTANVLTTIYTVPAATNTMITTITICNQSSNDSVFINVAANISGSAVTTRNFIVSGYSLGGAETLVLEPRISLNVGSILSANITGANASSNVSINAFGVEII